jgi:hypothetical protein
MLGNMQAEMYWKVLKSHIDFLQLLLSIPFNILDASRKAHKFQVPNTHTDPHTDNGVEGSLQNCCYPRKVDDANRHR